MQIRIYVFLSLLCASLSVSATIIDNGSYTTDTETGLDWLDVTETLRMPYRDVFSELSGGSLVGWRYASGIEFDELVSNFGITPQNNSCTNGGTYCDLLGGESTQVKYFIDLLGDTQIPSSIGGQNFISGITRGILSDMDTTRSYPYYWSALVSDYDFERTYAPGNITYGEDYIVTHIGSSYERDVRAFGGSFLVRPTSVPEPSTLLLMIPALLGLCVLKKREI